MNIKICKQCGKEYAGQGKNFCSRKCYRKNKGVGTKLLLVCEYCGKTFQVNKQSRTKDRFCSFACYNQFRKAGATKICEACNLEFLGKPQQRFCSRECAGKSSQNRRIISCDYCQKKFSRNFYSIENTKNHFCSKECYDNFQRRSRIKLVCKECGLLFEAAPREVREGRRFCSRACANNHKKGKGKLGAKGKIQRICEVCGTSFYVWPSRISQYNGRGARFCSSACNAKWISLNLRGKKHPNWKRLRANCDFCGKTFFVTPSKIKRQQYIFCSQRCYNLARGEITQKQWLENMEYSNSMRGKSHPSWRGGFSRSPYPFEFDESKKQEIRERDDFECVLCRKNIGNQALSVHHIDYDKTNCAAWNLVSLCKSCHSRTTSGNRVYWQTILTPIAKGAEMKRNALVGL